MKTRFLPLALLLFTLGSPPLHSQQMLPIAEGLLPSGYSIFGLSVVDKNTVWAVANVDTATYGPVPADHVVQILRTTDGGLTWAVTGVEESMGRVSWDIQAVDGNTAWLTTQDLGSGLGRALYKTEDGGETWTQKLFHRAGGAFVRLLDEQHIYCQNGRFVAWSSDNGETWEVDTLSAYAPNEFNILTAGNNMAAAVGSTVWVGTNKGRVCRATDYGQNIEMIDIGQGSDAEITSVAFNDHLHGMLQTWKTDGTVTLLKTDDAGSSWVPTASQLPQNGDTYNIAAVPGRPGVFFLITDGYTTYMTEVVNVFYTVDFGGSWTHSSTFEGTSNAIDFTSMTNGWATISIALDDNLPLIYKWQDGGLFNRLFVNDDATGLNNGTSWADAFTDLQAALAHAEEGGQIWVAEGTYLPGTDPTATYFIDKNLQLYGGFVGTESSLSERGDPAEHPTVLSGDLNGDDVDDDFVTNRGDNVHHVMQIPSGISAATLIDGFIIEGGQADGASGQRDGGGILCFGKPIIKHCIFRQNYATERGGAVSLRSIPAPGPVFENCTFNHNQSNWGGAIVIGASSYFTITQCSFTGNKTHDGAIQANGGAIGSTNAFGVVQHCTFNGNYSFEYGGAILAWTFTGFNGGSFEIKDCFFENNSAGLSDGAVALTAFGDNSHWTVSNSDFIGNSATFGNGGLSLHVNSNAPYADNSQFEVTNCRFIGNSAGNNGGGLGVFETVNAKNSSFTIDSCFFSQNTSKGGSGLGANFNGQETNFQLLNSTFTENFASEWYATAFIWNWANSTATSLVSNCLFENNVAANSSGLDVGSGFNAGVADFHVQNCQFINNQASYSGGLSLWGDAGSSPTFTVEDCQITGNVADERAGGIWILTSSDKFNATLNRCEIRDNHSPWGGAIGAFQADLSTYNLPTGSVFSIENSLIAGNTGDGGIITLDSFPGFEMLNTTVAENTSTAIVLGTESGLSMQNTILANPGHTEFVVSSENITVTSHGGNLVLDNSMNEYLTALDKPETEPDFMPGTYEPSPTSPLVNAGINDGVTAIYDLAGNDRIQQGTVDIGAFESPYTIVSTREIHIGEISLSPNPTSDLLYLALPDKATPTGLAVFDAQGRLVLSQKFAAGDALRVGHLPDGVFMVKVTDGERVYVGKFVKK